MNVRLYSPHALLCCLFVFALGFLEIQRSTVTAAEDWSSLTFHKAANPLPNGAVTESWPRFLGPHDNATSRETGLDLDWPAEGPPLVWEAGKGAGYSSPSIADGRLFLFHRPDDAETLECLDPETGKRIWTFSYPIEYSDRYGFSAGPRASPVIDGDRVYTFGVTAVMHCLEAATGKVVWRRDLKSDYDVPQYFFGSGPTPILWNDYVLQNIGGRDETDGKGVCVVALDKMTGKEAWRVEDEWGASYASPIVAKLHGKDCMLVLAGGDSKPATGGLLCIDPRTGKLHLRFAWRADKYESVNASTPVAIDDKRVFISETYMIGGVMLEFDEKLQPTPVWKSRDCGMHWMTPVVKDGNLYGFAGRNEPDAFLGCFNVDTGKEIWRDTLRWQREFDLQGGKDNRRQRSSSQTWSFFRGSLLQVQDTFIGLGELGKLARFDLNSEGPGVSHKAELFTARETWSLPVLHRGLLYIGQHGRDLTTGAKSRLLCYDLRTTTTAEIPITPPASAVPAAASTAETAAVVSVSCDAPPEDAPDAADSEEDTDTDTDTDTPETATPTPTLELKSGDTVALLGNTFFERERQYGQIETLLTAALPDTDLTVRNLGWSGDSVFGHARSYFGPPQEGLDRLKADLELIKPTVVIFNYGAAAAFEGEAGLANFIDGYGKLIDLVNSATDARLVLMSPPPCETLGSPLPDMEPQNQRLKLYAAAIGKLASERKLVFADLFSELGAGDWKAQPPQMTENGVHFTNEGYRFIAPSVLKCLGIQAHQLSDEHASSLRSAIIEKNTLFFHRWRPQNETYLRGFRKHEQGQNAKEIPLFDPLIAEKEKEIATLRKEAQP